MFSKEVNEQNKELPQDFFYYHCHNVVLANMVIFGSDPNGFSDYYLMIRHRCGIKQKKELQGIKNFANNAR